MPKADWQRRCRGTRSPFGGNRRGRNPGWVRAAPRRGSSARGDSRGGELMAGSPLGLSAENPVTSARIKCAHALGRFPTWNRFQTKTWGPVTGPRAGPKRTGGRGSPKTQFCPPGNREENKPGDAGGRDPSGKGNGKEQNQEAAAARLPSDTGATSRRAAARPAGQRSPPDAASPAAADGSAEGSVPPGKAPSTRGRQHPRALPGAPAPPLSAAAGAGGWEAHAGNNAGQPAPGPILARPKQSVEEGRGQRGTGCHLGIGTQSGKKSPGSGCLFFFQLNLRGAVVSTRPCPVRTAPPVLPVKLGSQQHILLSSD